jgi:hypothetical protein
MLPSGYQLIFMPKYWQGVDEGILRQYFGSPSIGGAHLGSNQTCPTTYDHKHEWSNGLIPRRTTTREPGRQLASLGDPG